MRFFAKDIGVITPEPILAGIDDQQVIIDLLDGVSRWLQTKGTDQWAKPWPSRTGRDRRVRKSIDAGTTWIQWAGSPDRPKAVATITVEPDGSDWLWTPGELAEPAGYVRRLAVNREYAGRKIGAKLLDWAGGLAAKRYRADKIRIDVWTDNTALHNYYTGIGFEPVRVVDVPLKNIPMKDVALGGGGSARYPSGALFQRQIVTA